MILPVVLQQVMIPVRVSGRGFFENEKAFQKMREEKVYEAAHQRDGCSDRICGDADRMYSGGDPDSGGVGTGISDLFWIFGKPGIFDDRYFENVMERNQDGEEHSVYLPFDWNADSTLEGGRDDSGDRILLCGTYEPGGHGPDGISFKCSGVCPDRNGIWYSSNHGCDLYDDGKGNGM